MKLMVYSHDAFGLGNIRRMVAICSYLLDAMPGLSVLVVSGSPALHSFRLSPRLDYIKLPCLSRDQAGQMGATFLDTSLEETVNLRAELILSATQHFKPDVFLVDKKPSGLLQELQPTLNYLERRTLTGIKTQLVLLLRDILDAPEVTRRQWKRQGYFDLVERLYSQIWVVGSPDVFDLPREYGFPEAIANKVRFCGYIRRQPGRRSRATVRQDLYLNPEDQMVLVTPGGGADGESLVMTYLKMATGPAAATLPVTLKSLIVCGYEMPLPQRQRVHDIAAAHPYIEVIDFSDDVLSLMDAADLVVSMGGYNTTCEILSLRKRAVVVPRIHPVQEQWMRSERLAQRQLLYNLPPQQLSPEALAVAVKQQLKTALPPTQVIDLGALPRISKLMAALLPCPFTTHSFRSSFPCLVTAP
ncbi:MAG: glycosyltransferase [Cyanobacteria bacterium P01_A01_bin.135]